MSHEEIIKSIISDIKFKRMVNHNETSIEATKERLKKALKDFEESTGVSAELLEFDDNGFLRVSLS